ncbi:MAG: hypothetical protein L6R41_001253 [Letrouitia leprolyta]|nr:MAG: hypothetical protein L6R41_001253 [Letrouitia leprolyta]
MSSTPTADVAYDAFLNPTCNGPGDPHIYEVMIWLAQLGGLNPISDGNPTSGIQLAGSSWKLYSGKNTNTGTTVYSFVSDGQINEFGGDLMEFFGYLVKNKGVDGGLLVTSMQAGTEVSVGQGRFETSLQSRDHHTIAAETATWKEETQRMILRSRMENQ